MKSFLSMLTLLFTVSVTQNADAQSINGSWTLNGADFLGFSTALELGVDIADESGVKVMRLNQSLNIPEIPGCTLTPANTFANLVPTGTNGAGQTTYSYQSFIPLVFLGCAPFNIKNGDIFIKEFFNNNNSFTGCRSDQVNDCGTFTRVGSGPVTPPPGGGILSTDFVPPAPRVKVRGSNVTVSYDAIDGATSYLVKIQKRKTKALTATTTGLKRRFTDVPKGSYLARFKVNFIGPASSSEQTNFGTVTAFSVK